MALPVGVREGCAAEAVTGRAFEEAFSRQRKEDPENRKAFDKEGAALFTHFPDIELLLSSRHCEDTKMKKI